MFYDPAPCLGRALILSVEKDRTGAEAERQDAKAAFVAMGFLQSDIVVCRNPTQERIFTALRELRDMD